MISIHTPVMAATTIRYLLTKPAGVYVDGTLGTGGHLSALSAKLHPTAFLIGIDADAKAVEYCQKNLNLQQKTRFVNANFEELMRICYRAGFTQVDGILLDLGLSSFALDNPQRGFAYASDGPLDMRFSTTNTLTAADFINDSDLPSLIRVFTEFGEERQAKQIARQIIKHRAQNRIQTTRQLAEIIKTCVAGSYQSKTLSRIFQAIRININRELIVLKSVLAQAVDLLAPGGHLVILTYHSLEDRIVKQYFKTESSDCLCPPEFPVCQCQHKARLKILTPKPITAEKAEIQSNPRARSAKLRAVEKIRVVA